MDNEIKVMIVDDEQEAIDLLVILLSENFSNIKVVATARKSDEAINLVCRKHPDIIFLDIEIDTQNGFDVVEKLKQENHLPHIIFVTAYNKYAVDAFKTNALDYLLKPLDTKDLIRAIDKFAEQREKELQHQDIKNHINNYQPKIKFNTQNGYILVNPEEVVYCESDGNYSHLYLKDQSKKTVCYNLRNLFKQLPHPQFKRISRYYLVNENFLSEVNRGKQECILSVNEKEIILNFSSKMFY